ncbi:hypothetical protein [Streptomyces lydicus]|uniref:hypothetical protein n=1 Tax=Streptomyces lydicus TaxID=47763 RepID=UPI0036FA5AA1
MGFVIQGDRCAAGKKGRLLMLLVAPAHACQRDSGMLAVFSITQEMLSARQEALCGAHPGESAECIEYRSVPRGLLRYQDGQVAYVYQGKNYYSA